MKPKPLLTLVAILLISVSLVCGAMSSVIIQFEEIGGNVVARTTGSFQVPINSPNGSISAASPQTTSFSFFWVNGTGSLWNGGTFTSSGLSRAASSATGDTFGYSTNSVIMPQGVTPGSSFTPNTTWTWNGRTLTDIGLGSLTTTPSMEFSGSGDTISFALIPEPATIALFLGGASAVFLALRRNVTKRSISDSQSPASKS